MKSSAVLASLLFGSLAVAAPFDKRSLVYKTETVTETVVLYTTVYDDEPATTTSSQAVVYNQPTAPADSTSTYTGPTYTPPAPAQPSSISAPQVQPSSAAPPPEQPPATTPTVPYVVPTPPASSVVPPPQSSPPQPSSTPTGPSTTGGESYSDVDLTIYNNNGGYGACGTALVDTDMIVAIAHTAWGSSTYDVMTGKATNPWCGQKVRIEYGGKSVDATVMDMCPGCSGHDLDLSQSVWDQLTDSAAPSRVKASWSKIS